MPLHLLGKKSWNVYNADNVARVRRDEADAKAKEEAEEQRMQEIDSERRLAILRGEEPPPLSPAETPRDAESRAGDRDRAPSGRERKKRKRAGEDDTEFELRTAKERSDMVHAANDSLRKSTSSAPIVDIAGHIDLFGEERKQGRHLKNEEAEKEASKKKKEQEDQYTMRFSNAAGRDGLVDPWYANSASRADSVELESPGRDAFGNEDSGRKKRDAQRIVASDPLAMMKRGAARVREVKKERQMVEDERQRELEQLRREEKRKEKHESRHREQKSESSRHERDGDRHWRSRHRGSREGDDERRDRSHQHDSHGSRREEGRTSHREDRRHDERDRRDRHRDDGSRRDHKRHGRDSSSRRRDDDDRREQRRREKHDERTTD